MKNLTSTTLLTLAVLLCIGPVVSAQEERPNTAAAPNRTHMLLEPTTKLDMKGAKLSELMTFLNKDETFNVIISDEVKDLSIPSINGKNMSVLSVLSIVESACPSLQIQLVHRAATFKLVDAEAFVENNPDRLGDWTILCKRRDGWTPYTQSEEMFGGESEFGMGAPAKAPVEVGRGIYSVGSMITKTLTIEALASSIELVWKEVKSTQPPSIQLHEETGLLFCSGSALHITLADQVLSQLQGGTEVLQRSLSGRTPSSDNDALLKQLSSTVDHESLERKYASELNIQKHEFEARLHMYERAGAEAEARVRDLLKKLEAREQEITMLQRKLAIQKP